MVDPSKPSAPVSGERPPLGGREATDDDGGNDPTEVALAKMDVKIPHEGVTASWDSLRDIMADRSGIADLMPRYDTRAGERSEDGSRNDADPRIDNAVLGAAGVIAGTVLSENRSTVPGERILSGRIATDGLATGGDDADRIVQDFLQGDGLLFEGDGLSTDALSIVRHGHDALITFAGLDRGVVRLRNVDADSLCGYPLADGPGVIVAYQPAYAG